MARASLTPNCPRPLLPSFLKPSVSLFPATTPGFSSSSFWLRVQQTQAQASRKGRRSTCTSYLRCSSSSRRFPVTESSCHLLFCTLSGGSDCHRSSRESRQGDSEQAEKMMLAEVANHSKRNHTDSYFSGKAVTTTSSEEFGSMSSKKPRNASPRAAPISPKKDKIGERVAALQQLVSPFGKTDTASVLQEASGYIKFLHQQLEVLSSPYMRPPLVAGAAPEDPDHYSLRNRGLCLVPVDQTLQLTQSNGADLWAPANTTRRR